MGVVGASGSGKSTLLKALCGLLTPFKGKISTIEADGASTWFAPQSPALLPFRTSVQNAVLGVELSRELDRSDVETAKNMLSAVGLPNALDQLPGELSGGMRKRVALVQALLANRPLTLLDEPLSELDGQSRVRCETVILERQSQDGRAQVLVSHDIDTICALSDWVLVLGGAPNFKTAKVVIERAQGARSSIAAAKKTPGFMESVIEVQRQLSLAQQL